MSKNKKPAAHKPGAAIVQVTPSKNIVLLRTSMEAVNKGLVSMAALLSKPEIPATVLAAAYNLIDKTWKKIIEDQREAVRTALMQLHADQEQEQLQYVYDGKEYTTKVTHRRETDPSPELMRAACAEKGITYESVCDELIVHEFNREKALKAGFTPPELESMRKTKSVSLSMEVR
ncbi:hypothetical protein [Caudoviricetes sp.]|nr:hypothetical protein [Caudoviricetes sp.]